MAKSAPDDRSIGEPVDKSGKRPISQTHIGQRIPKDKLPKEPPKGK